MNPLPPPVIRMASSERRGRGPERRTTGVPAPIISLGSRLLFLSQWSRQTGLGVVVAKGAAAKRGGVRGGGRCRTWADDCKSWMPDEDSNLD